MRAAGELRVALRNVSVKALSLGFERVCRFVVVIAAAPALGRAAFGDFVFASTVTALLALGTDLGLGVWTTRALARSRADSERVVRLGLTLRGLASVPYALAIGLAAAFAAHGPARAAVALLGVGALVNAYVDHFGAILRGHERFVDEARLNASRAVLTAGAGLATLTFARSLTGLCAALAAASVASCAQGLVCVLRLHARAAPAGNAQAQAQTQTRRPVATFDRALARAALRQSVPIWIAGLLSVLYFKVDNLFLRSLSDAAELGAYGAAYKLFEGAMIVPSVVLSVAFPRLARAHRDPPTQRGLERTIAALLLGLGAMAASVCLFGGSTLVGLLFGPGFARSVPCLRILALGLPLLFVNFGLTHFLVARDLGRMTTWFALAMLVINVALNAALVPRQAGPGAAWATVLTELALTACCVAGLRMASAWQAGALRSIREAPRTARRAA
ncbi:MAG TPA: oligosaccharide flippase family protein [Polyangiaceae bacterium]|nr:oligosaccharide flippase family protein [Polyangiaceae bacterium]